MNNTQTTQSQFAPTPNLKVLLENLSSTGFKCTNAIDVGAHQCVWSRNAKLFFPDSNFYLIEPLKEMEDGLKKFCEEYPGSKYFLNGAGSKEETLYLTVWEDNLAGTCVMHNKNDKLNQRDIQIVTIDKIIEENNLAIPEMAKLDVQGFELEALKGATKLLGTTEVFIVEAGFYEIIPNGPIFSDIVIFMKEHGYELYDLTGFYRRKKDFALMCIDLCFVKKSGFFRN